MGRRIFKRKKTSNLFVLVLIILGISVGYALLSTTLNINGVAGINKHTWDIHWDPTSVKESLGSVTATTPAYVSDSENKVITFGTELELPGDYYEFTMDARNYGDIDAILEKIDVNFYKEDGVTPMELSNCLQYSLTHADDTPYELGETLLVGKSIKYKFRLEFKDVDELNCTAVPPNVEIKPKFVQPTQDQYKITFNPNGGEVSESTRYVNKGSAVGNLPLPTKGSEEFQGWYTDIEDGIQVTSATVPNGNVTYYAHWPFTMATFDYGESVNKKLKVLAGTTNAGYYTIDTNITSIQLSQTPIDESLKDANHTVSVDGSIPIYAWYENGVIYLWSEADRLYLNSNASRMFYNLRNVTSIYTGFKTNNTTSMDYMFANCYSLTDIDVSKFNTSKVSSFSNTFNSCGSLKSLNLSKWDVSKVTYFNNMFEDCASLETLNIKNWDMKEAYTFDSTFKGCVKLETLDFSTVKVGRSVRYMNNMFTGDYSLKELDLSMFSLNYTNTVDQIFSGCTGLKKLNIKGWFFKNFSSISGLFSGLISLEEINLEDVNTSNITNMSGLFAGCISLETLDLYSFDTSKVTNMGGMFSGCGALTTISVSDDFVVSNVTTDGGMFASCNSLVGGAGTLWDENYINKERAHYDYGEVNPGYFNSKLVDPVIVTLNPNGGTVSPTRIVVERGSEIGDLPIPVRSGYSFNGWYKLVDETGVEVTRNYIVNEPITITASWLGVEAKFDRGLTVNQKWKELAGTDAIEYDYGVSDNNITAVVRSPIAPADIESLNDSDHVVSAEGSLPIYSWYDNGTIYWWTEAPVAYLNEDASYMFYGLKKVEEIDTSFDTSLTTNMQFMFSSMGTIEELDLSKFNTSSVVNMSYMFSSSDSLVELDLSSFNTSNVTDMQAIFNYANGLQKINMSNWDFRNYDYESLFGSKLSVPYTVKTLILDNAIFGTTMNRCFAYLNYVETISLKNVDTSRVRDMYYLFCDCYALKELDLSDFDTSKVTTMYGAFAYLRAITSIDLTGWDTSRVTNMHYMFSSDSNLTSLDLSMFNISKMDDMQYMFSGCSGIKTLNLSNWDFSNYDQRNEGLMIHIGASGLSSIETLIMDNTVYSSNMYYAFGGMSSLKRISLVNADTSRVTTMYNMFNGDSNIETLSLGSFDTRNVTDMRYMFSFMSSLKRIYVSDNFVVTQVTQDENMFSSLPVLTGGMGTPYTDDHKNKEYAHYDGGPSNPGYFQKGSEITYTITLDPNGGTVNPTSIVIYAGESLGSLPIAEKEQSVFNGWKFKNPEGGFVSSDYIPNSDLELVADYRTANIYTITFEANAPEEENVVITPSTKTVYEGNSIGEFPTVTRENWYVDYWYLPDTGISVGESYVPNSDLTLWPKWKVNTEECDFDCQKCILNPASCNKEGDPVDPYLYCSIYNIGDTRKITLNIDANNDGESETIEHTVRVANCSYPSSCTRTGHSQTACGVVYEFADVVAFRPMNSTSTTNGGWRDSELRQFVNNLGLPGVPTRVVSGEGLNERANGEYVTTDTAYLLSKREVYGDSSPNWDQQIHEVTSTHTLDIYSVNTFVNKGVMYDSPHLRAKTCYAYIPSIGRSGYWCGGSSIYDLGTADPDSESWWLRNVDYANYNNFGVVRGHGYYPDYSYYQPTSLSGVSPAFRIAP